MLYRILYVTFFLVFLYSEELTLVYIETISNNFINSRIHSISGYTIKSIEPINTKDDYIGLYIVDLNPIGFIIVSAENRTVPILGYSFDNIIDINNLV